jgi:putative nucleotidyltransferase with HDIG domain
MKATQLIENRLQPTPKNPFVPVDLNFFTLDSVCDHHIYLNHDGNYVLYRAAHLPFTMADKQRLEVAKVFTVYIYCESEADLRRFFEGNLTTIIDSPKISSQKKADVLYQCASGIAKDIFDNPEQPKNLASTKTVVEGTIRLMAKNSNAFLEMISLSSHDYYTYTHCVNVMTFTVGLLSAMGINDPQILKEAGMGALLHDIGKARVPLAILNKPGPLTEDEWSVMKKHPTFGYEMLYSSAVPERGKEIVQQHHEKITGIGYPFGLRGDKIPIVSQVVSLCDAYDAMTTNRVYQKAMKPFDAFKIIAVEMKNHFDPNLVEKFIQLLNLRKRS